MIHAREDYNRIQDPSGLIPDDEPVFLLRAQDATAPAVVRTWADMAEAAGADARIVLAARHQAFAMESWQAAFGSKTPDI